MNLDGVNGFLHAITHQLSSLGHSSSLLLLMPYPFPRLDGMGNGEGGEN